MGGDGHMQGDVNTMWTRDQQNRPNALVSEANRAALSKLTHLMGGNRGVIKSFWGGCVTGAYGCLRWKAGLRLLALLSWEVAPDLQVAEPR